MSNAVRNHLDRQPFNVADGLVMCLAITHYTGQLQGFGNPATVVLALQLNGQLHLYIIDFLDLRFPTSRAEVRDRQKNRTQLGTALGLAFRDPTPSAGAREVPVSGLLRD